MNSSADKLVTVIIPTYNHGKYINRCLRSVLEQSYKNFEIIVIDNNSTDNTEELINNFSDQRIKYLKTSNNGIIAKSRNVGLLNSNGDWIAFLDSDDWWEPNKLEVCIENISPDIDFMYHDLEIISVESRFFMRRQIKSRQVVNPVLNDLLIYGNTIATSSTFIRATLLRSIGGMSENPLMVAAEDFNTWLRISKITNNFKYISHRLGFYQLHNQGISRKDMSEPMSHAIQEFLETLNSLERKKIIANLNYIKGRFNYLKGNYSMARKNLSNYIFNGAIGNKLKAIYMILMMSLRWKIKNRSIR